MYLIEKDKELSTLKLGTIISRFLTFEYPKLCRYENYYKGKQQILQKVATDTGKPCNRIIVNYCRSITDQFNGYLTGIPIQYNGNNIEQVIDVLNYNDSAAEDNELLHNALIYGVGYEINYIDEDGKQRFKVLDSKQCIPIYSADLNHELEYVVRFYQEDLINEQKYRVEVYGKYSTKYYNSLSGFSTFNLIEEVQNYYNQVPVTVFELNKDNTNIFDSIMSLQDGYNTLVSSEVDDFEAFCDSYLILTGQIADKDDLAAMKEHRVLMLDSGATANYLTKNVSDTLILNMLENFNNQIYNKANCVDFNDKNFQASTGIALKLKLVGFESEASSIETQMKKALQKRIELICSILSLTGEEAWRDVLIVFTRNLPTNLADIASTLNLMRGLVSDETLLSLIPFVQDIAAELEKLKREKEENMSLYSFGVNDADTNETEE